MSKRIDILISNPNKYETAIHIPGNGIVTVRDEMLDEFMRFKLNGYFWPYDVEWVNTKSKPKVNQEKITLSNMKHYFKFTEVPLLYPEE